MEIVNVFECLLEEQLLGYHSSRSSDKNLIDFHGYQSKEAQFVIRYVFGFKVDYLKECCEQYGNIQIIVGKGNGFMAIMNEREGGVLKDFLIKELKSWNPPINCHVDASNTGRLIIEASDIEPY